MNTARVSVAGTHCLATRQILEIEDAADLRIECTSGCLWITLDHDPRDIVLEPGEAVTDLGHRRALVYALQDSRLVVVAQEEPVVLAAALRVRPLLAAH